MTSKSISITDDVYEMLDKFRLKNESFSQVIKRLIESNLNIKDLAGAWQKIPDAEDAIDFIEKMVKKVHDNKNDELNLI